MTTYGTIPTASSSDGTPNLEYIVRAKEMIQEGLGTSRPWKIMFDFRSFSLPANLAEALFRLRANAAYFRMNYAIVILIIVFLSLLWHPVSLIVFIAMTAAWLYLYFQRDQPLVVFGRTIDDKTVLIGLGVLTVLVLLLTNVTWNVLGSLVTGVVVVAAHGVTRKTDDLILDEEATGLIGSAAGGGAASSSS